MALIDNQAAINAIENTECELSSEAWDELTDAIMSVPSAQPETHYCRECKWSRCHVSINKYSETETYWRCLNWDGETDEEGFCHEWERRTDGTD